MTVDDPAGLRAYILKRSVELWCPFPVRRASGDPRAEERLVSWIVDTGLAGPLTDEQRNRLPVVFAAYRLTEWRALNFPDVLERETQWLMDRWLGLGLVLEWILDQSVTACPGQDESTWKLGEQLARLFRTGPGTGLLTPKAWAAAVTCTAELLEETERRHGTEWRQEFGDAFARTVEASVLETTQNTLGRVTGLTPYLWLRPDSYGSLPHVLLALMSQGVHARARFLRHACAAGAVRAAILHNALVNDILGYAKESVLENLNGNAVLIVQRQHGATLHEAVSTVIGMCNEQVRTLEHFATLLRESAVGFPTGEQSAVAPFTEMLRSNVSGVIRWHLTAPQYAAWTPEDHG
ncbi:hypothetical protein ACFP1Z_19080 [Streptomyces gamaensis]|uniref:Terpene synthase n=1 Tax=Streptomyces gamaensis TaxID=1763542 RepID=A0ABW0Z3A2_9ACTN